MVEKQKSQIWCEVKFIPKKYDTEVKGWSSFREAARQLKVLILW